MKRILTIAAVSALLVAPAFAQSNTDTAKSDNMSSDKSGNMSSGMSANPQNMTASQQKVRDELTKAGYTNVQVEAASYLVSAKAPGGEQVMMIIDTRQTGGASGTSGNAKSSGSSSSSTNK